MSNNAVVSLPWVGVESQPADVRELSDSQRNNLIVNAIQVEGHWVIISRYGDDCWQLDGVLSNKSDHFKRLNFQRVPAAFRAVMKAVMYRYLRHGQAGKPRPKGGTLKSFLGAVMPFLNYLDKLTIARLALVTPIVSTNYVTESREYCQSFQGKSKPLSQPGLVKRFQAVEALYQLSQYTHDPIPQHPWHETSANALAGLTGSGAIHKQGCKTPLIPDDVFCTLFNKAYGKFKAVSACSIYAMPSHLSQWNEAH